jgi:signal transduction histidine kinase
VRLPRLFRTSSFRLTLVYAGLFAVSALMIFGVIYWTTKGFMQSQFDESVDDELNEVLEDAGRPATQPLQAAVLASIARDPKGWFYQIQGPAGDVLAGNLPRRGHRDVIGETRDGRRIVTITSGKSVVRGSQLRLADGGNLFVGADSSQLIRTQTLVARSFSLGLCATLLLALGAGAVISHRLLRRIEAIGRTSREIMDGDLSRRIPIHGSDDEFDHLAVGLNAMLERIEKLMDGVREVSSDIAHDLRTPLSRLRQRLEIASRRAETIEELRAAIDGSVIDVDAILDTFGSLLRIVQIEGGSRRSGFTTLDLGDVLQTMIEIYQPVAEENGQSVTGEIASGLFVRGDRELLIQMLANLIENAVCHTPAGARITLCSARRDGVVEVEVSDDGPGIPEALREKVFQRFYRIEPSRRAGGNGLGLSIVAAICALHEVEIVLADNRPGLRVSLLFRPQSPPVA